MHLLWCLLKDLDWDNSMVFVGPISLDFQLLFNKEQCRLLIIKTLFSGPFVDKVKAMVFPAVMYGCESCTIKKAKNWCFLIVVLEKTLGSPLDCRRSNKSFLKEINLEYSGPMLKLQYFGYLMWRAVSLEKTSMLGNIEGRRRRGWQRIRGLKSITPMDMSLSKLRETVEVRGAWHAAVHGVAKSQTQLSELNNSNSNSEPLQLE